MIDEQKTFETFGYYSREVSKNKKVVAHCDSCNSNRIISKYSATKAKVCAKCQRIAVCKINAITNRFGRKHSDETKKKIGTSNFKSQKRGELSPNYGKTLSEYAKHQIAEANKVRIWTDESKKKLSDSHTGKKLSVEHREKLTIKNKLRSGVNSPLYGKPASHGKGEYYLKIDGTKIWMRSFWEIQTAKYLDTKKYNWVYEPGPFSIKYVIKDKQIEGTYRPDFYIIELDEYWEIKGWWRDDGKAKFSAFIEQYKKLNIRLFMKTELEELGISLKPLKK